MSTATFPRRLRATSETKALDMDFRSAQQGADDDFTDTLVFGRPLGSVDSVGTSSMNGDQMVDQQVHDVRETHDGDRSREAVIGSERA